MPPNELRPSPGMYPRHYAPKAKVELVDEVPDDAAGLVFGPAYNPNQVPMPDNPGAYGAALYAALHRLDDRSPDVILIELPPDEPEWEAVVDRLRKAAG